MEARVAATPRVPRGYSVEARRGDAAGATWILRGGARRGAAAGATWIFRGGGLLIRPRDRVDARRYKTAPECSAAQWLEPAQTAGKKRPYLFTQCQAIHARALLPCQDAPGAKMSWDAVVDAPAWATALLSGLHAPRGLPFQPRRVKMIPVFAL